MKVFFWTLGIFLMVRGFQAYLDWFMGSAPDQRFLAVLGKSVLFLYIRIFWPGTLVWILPGLREFRCPQCYEKRTFRFLPVSASFGNWVTYLCPHCSCLVDGWGGQIFYPRKAGKGIGSPGRFLVPVGAFVSLGLGIWLGEVLVRIL